uniref:Uncharacterized protein n=1 Tax=Pipistrellus kuhlii TaxID=59472 RepID=A0A7J7UTN0_PIPKU|nr:hypothetical protein mPipKuh1_008731 [Pipistrellus kuhlii]
MLPWSWLAGNYSQMWVNGILFGHFMGIFTGWDMAPTCQTSCWFPGLEIVHWVTCAGSPGNGKQGAGLCPACLLTETVTSQIAKWVSTCHILPTDISHGQCFPAVSVMADHVCGLGLSATTCPRMTQTEPRTRGIPRCHPAHLKKLLLF